MNLYFARVLTFNIGSLCFFEGLESQKGLHDSSTISILSYVKSSVISKTSLEVLSRKYRKKETSSNTCNLIPSSLPFAPTSDSDIQKLRALKSGERG